MEILFTACSFVALLGCVLAYTRSEREAETSATHCRNAERAAMSLRTERDRVTVLERETEALRRELRKLSGKFYASQREHEQVLDIIQDADDPPVCENYAVAQREGPKSTAASCECDYCTRRRKEKREFRDRQAIAGHLDPRWIAAHTSGTGNHGE